MQDSKVGLGGREGDENVRASRRVELSLEPEKVNEGIAKGDLKAGFVSEYLFPVWQRWFFIDSFIKICYCPDFDRCCPLRGGSRLHLVVGFAFTHFVPVIQGGKEATR